MTQDTQIGGPSGKFPATRWSAVRAARSTDLAERKRALETIIVAYWKPIYKYTRIRWGKTDEDAKDLTQEFFARLIEKNYLADFDSSKARLRTFLRVGGSAEHISLDFAVAGFEMEQAKVSLTNSASPERIDEFLEKEFLRSLFGLAVEDLRKFCESRGKKTHFRLFEIHDLEDADSERPSYAELAAQFKIALTDVTNYLAFSRREFRRIALEKLREMTTSEDEYRREARALLGVESE